ncbi:MAG: quinohemoprotein amine dehydrogenase subunit beta [Arcobacter sp.]|jgi:quinohemoprotein amine dehydrogenase beta subunit|uniref:Quinohemoprotein amine dehydrogenase, beta subunit n=1 Tax=Arcobacter defluvii TaxID=873191 RepID=A0AAE7BF96_9BACT|nr:MULTISPECIES: quinohemoprotein amine dehydrogenase subunit beta [Arcobacter]MDY3201388.1 quinohemoprotein amine dehydrogenase subunit beta [Arcobacter sp.]QKF76674.1 quinohemoprotein amine dehydrogenase, beta subunit [Arcobacter defluvii]RXI34820.1 quinohemoprotein amine dehydrogenase subunit beta [Arcobacter defluvii]BAK72485.1 quinohemoprotein amine dehydrogenase beta subunit [Arcobacter sp. L]
MLNKEIIKKGLGLLSLSVVLSSGFSTNLNAANVKLESNHNYLVTETRPNNIVLADLETNKVINECKTDETFSPGGIVLSPDYKVAYILGGYGEEIAGYEIETCKKVFHTSLTQGNIRAKSLFGLAVNEDGTKVYAIYNRTEMLNDRYKVLPPHFSVYNVADGLDAKPVKSFEMPRQTTVVSTGKDGKVYVVGTDLYEVNPTTGDIKVAKKIVKWGKEGYSDLDSAANYIIGQQTGDLTALYATIKYDDPKNPSEDAGTWYWGITSVDLNTGEIIQQNISEYETLMFTAIRSPKDSNILYGVLNDLTKFDLKEQKVLKRVVTDHTYYSVVPSMDGDKLYLGSCLDDIAVYDANTLEKIGKIQLSGDMGSAALQVFKTK